MNFSSDLVVDGCLDLFLAENWQGAEVYEVDGFWCGGLGGLLGLVYWPFAGSA